MQQVNYALRVFWRGKFFIKWNSLYREKLLFFLSKEEWNLLYQITLVLFFFFKKGKCVLELNNQSKQQPEDKNNFPIYPYRRKFVLFFFFQRKLCPRTKQTIKTAAIENKNNFLSILDSLSRYKGTLNFYQNRKEGYFISIVHKLIP